MHVHSSIVICFIFGVVHYVDLFVESAKISCLIGYSVFFIIFGCILDARIVVMMG